MQTFHKNPYIYNYINQRSFSLCVWPFKSIYLTSLWLHQPNNTYWYSLSISYINI